MEVGRGDTLFRDFYLLGCVRLNSTALGNGPPEYGNPQGVLALHTLDQGLSRVKEKWLTLEQRASE